MTNDNSGNPAWKPILDVLPESLHGIVTPVLKQWDQGVQQKFQDIRNEYTELEGFKKFVEHNIDPEYIEQAVILADKLQNDPAKIVQQINEAWELGFVSKEDAAKLGSASLDTGGQNDFELDPDNDIFKDPRVAAMKQALEELQGNFQSEKQREEEEKATQEFEEYLDELEKSYTDPNREGGPLPFNRMFVTALISQGQDGDAAVKQYHQVLAANVDTTTPTPTNTPSGSEPPAVMGGEGTTGGGTPDGSVDIGSLSRKDLNSTVMQMLEQAQTQGN